MLTHLLFCNAYIKQNGILKESAFATLSYNLNLIFVYKKAHRISLLTKHSVLFCFRLKAGNATLIIAVSVFYKLHNVFYFAIKVCTNFVNRFHFNVLVCF